MGMTNMKFKNRTKASYTFLRVTTKLSDLDRKLRKYGTDQPLYEAEIHMIKSVKENEGIHVTGLADMLGVTKGAISQNIAKLERKGMIVKAYDPDNLSRLSLRLTPKGEAAYAGHEALHREFDDLFASALAGASEENKAFLKRFLDDLDARLDAFEKRDAT